MTDTDLLLAIIGGAHGIKGEVRVKSFTSEPTGFADYGKLHDKQGNKYQILKCRVSKNVVITRFKSIDSREKAEALNGVELFIDRSKLPETEDEEEFYISDLVNCDVKNEAGEIIGKLFAVQNFGAGDMLEIMPLNETNSIASNTYYLPFTKSVVLTVDEKNKEIVIRPPIQVSEREEEE